MVTILSKSRWYHSIRWKLFFYFLLIIFVPLLFFFNTLVVSIRGYFQRDREKKLQTSAVIVAGSIAKANYLGYLDDGSKRQFFDNELDEKSREGSFRILVFDEGGCVVNDSNQTEIGKYLLVPEVLYALEQKNDVGLREDEGAVYAAASIENDTGRKIGAVLLVASVEDIHTSVQGIEKTIMLYTLLTTLITGVLVFFVSQLLIDPLRQVLRVVRKMSDGHMNQRIHITGHDEYALQGCAFNEMAEKLEQVDKTREDFVSNVSHELKTPLSSMKVLSESILLQEDVPGEMYREFLQDINSEIDRMTNIVNDLLHLVKLDQREIGLNIKPMELNKVVEDVLKRLYPLAEQRGIDLIYEDMRKIVIEGDEMKLGLAISNLVENGIKYTQMNGTVRVTVDADHQNAFVTVADTGIGISDEEQGKVFNRFYRIDKTRDRETGGTGLGLSITRSTILLHNGSIRLSSKEYEGTTFYVRIPIHYNTEL